MGTFNKHYDDVVEAIITGCDVYASNTNKKPYHTEFAVWDTGSTNTVISMKIVKALGLRPIGEAIVGSFGGGSTSSLYLVDIGLPTKDVVLELEVIGSEDMEDYDILIGMDIINYGDMAITNKGDKTTFAFRIPSTEEICF